MSLTLTVGTFLRFLLFFVFFLCFKSFLIRFESVKSDFIDFMFPLGSYTLSISSIHQAQPTYLIKYRQLHHIVMIYDSYNRNTLQ